MLRGKPLPFSEARALRQSGALDGAFRRDHRLGLGSESAETFRLVLLQRFGDRFFREWRHEGVACLVRVKAVFAQFLFEEAVLVDHC